MICDQRRLVSCCFLFKTVTFRLRSYKSWRQTLVSLIIKIIMSTVGPLWYDTILFLKNELLAFHVFILWYKRWKNVQIFWSISFSYIEKPDILYEWKWKKVSIVFRHTQKLTKNSCLLWRCTKTKWLKLRSSFRSIEIQIFIFCFFSDVKLGHSNSSATSRASCTLYNRITWNAAAKLIISRVHNSFWRLE